MRKNEKEKIGERGKMKKKEEEKGRKRKGENLKLCLITNKDTMGFGRSIFLLIKRKGLSDQNVLNCGMYGIVEYCTWMVSLPPPPTPPPSRLPIAST